MARFKFVVLSNSIEGQDEEFNDWYSNQHIRDVVETPGFVRAERSKICPTEGDNRHYKYLAIYEMDSDSAEEAAATVAALFERGRGGQMIISSALDTQDILSAVFETIEGATVP